MTTFNTTNLVDGRVLVTGEDQFGTSGKAVLDGSQWAEINRRDEYSQATDAFDRAVEEFFAPLTDAADKLEGALRRPTDSLGYVVLEEAVEGTPAKAEKLIKLTKDSMVLRVLESGDNDRLVWVDEHLEILETISTPAAVSASGSTARKSTAKKTSAKK